MRSRSESRVLSGVFVLLVLMIGFVPAVRGQRTCGTDKHWQNLVQKDPTLLDRRLELEEQIQRKIRANRLNPNRSSVVVTIPVVFHILYNNSENDSTNISDAQILSQIDVLNEDFRALNSEIGSIPSPFSALVADLELEFCLAAVDPDGNPTSGITRTLTTVEAFNADTDDAKFDDTGGIDIWDRDSYLNFWIVPSITDNDTSFILGYAQFPGGPAETDGIVMRYTFTGRTPHNPFSSAFDLGRTATHEVGHWMNLIHIWGGDGCGGGDEVDDTPDQDGPNSGCPTFPRLDSCSTVAPGVMYMSYMDYVNDNCMVMFSEGQKERGRAALESSRASILASTACCPTNWLITGPLQHPNNYVRASDHITATTASLSSGAAGVLQAGNYVDMKTGFLAETGSDFIAVLQPCDSLAQDTKVTHD